MVSSLIGPQYHDGQFWKFSVSASQGSPNNFDIPVVPAFAADFEVIHRIEYNFNHTEFQYAHFHGTNDGAIKYDGQNPGPGFLSGAEVIGAQL